MAEPIHLPTRTLDTETVALLRSLTVGEKITVVQTVRVGSRKWSTTVQGTFRSINYLATGLATERLPQDDLIMPMVHFTKPNGEMSSIALDENSTIARA